MSAQTPCKQLINCIQFQDFLVSNPNHKLYVNQQLEVTITCPSGITSTTLMPAGIIGYVLKFTIGSPPYPDLSMNCTGGYLDIPVPATTTQPQLDALINGMLTQCVQQIAQNLLCQPGSYVNTAQLYNPCSGATPNTLGQGAVPGGVSPGNGLTSATGASISPGSIPSTVSIADANSKAQLLMVELYQTGNLICHS